MSEQVQYDDGSWSREMVPAMTLTDFLLARIAEDEAVAERLRHKSAGDPWGWQPRQLETCDKARVDYPPARVLAECEAKRRIVEMHGGFHECEDGNQHGPGGEGSDEFTQPCPTLRLLALPYADHPDYREEWRP